LENEKTLKRKNVTKIKKKRKKVFTSVTGDSYNNALTSIDYTLQYNYGVITDRKLRQCGKFTEQLLASALQVLQMPSFGLPTLCSIRSDTVLESTNSLTGPRLRSAFLPEHVALPTTNYM